MMAWVHGTITVWVEGIREEWIAGAAGGCGQPQAGEDSWQDGACIQDGLRGCWEM